MYRLRALCKYLQDATSSDLMANKIQKNTSNSADKRAMYLAIENTTSMLGAKRRAAWNSSDKKKDTVLSLNAAFPFFHFIDSMPLPEPQFHIPA